MKADSGPKNRKLPPFTLIMTSYLCFQNPVATGFEIFWMIFEPILFGITGTLVVFKTLEGPIVGLACACLIIGVIVSYEKKTSRIVLKLF